MEWISVNDRLPETNEKFDESDYLLCWANGSQFVGWYNSESKEWFLAHHYSISKPLKFQHVPTHWAELPKPPQQ